VKPKPLRVGRVTIGGKHPVFILGPCVIESEKVCLAHGEEGRLKSAPPNTLISFSRLRTNKANRTSVHSFRGIGVREGCEILSAIGRDLKITSHDGRPFAQ